MRPINPGVAIALRLRLQNKWISLASLCYSFQIILYRSVWNYSNKLTENIMLQKRITTFFILLFLVSLHVTPLMAQSKNTSNAKILDDKEKNEVVERIAQEVIKNYVFPQLAQQSADFITQQLKSGKYQEISDAKEFAVKLTEDLQSINHDKHMSVRVGGRGVMGRLTGDQSGDPTKARLQRDRVSQEYNYGFGKIEHLEGNVGYLNLKSFMFANSKAKKAGAAALQYLSASDAIILDLRQNRGGTGEMSQFVASYFLPEKTQLNSVYWRQGERTMESWTLDEVPGTRMLDVPLFLLTSSTTFSVAEAFTYDLQNRNRATIVGEVSRGGANPGESFAINNRFNIFVSTGRAINPVTQTNWEGVGVKPDIHVSADKTLNKAHELAKVAAEKFKQKDMESKLALYKAFENGLNSIEEKLTEGKQNPEGNQYQELLNKTLSKALEEELLDESAINNLGYEYLPQKNNPAMALLIFTYNTQAFPQSANAFDSLGEAHLKLGNKKLSEKNYEISRSLR